MRVDGIPVECGEASSIAKQIESRQGKPKTLIVPPPLDITPYVQRRVITITMVSPADIIDGVVVPMIVVGRTISELVSEVWNRVSFKQIQCQEWESREY